MKNTILEKFQKGEPCLGTFTHLLSNTGIRILSRTGMDYAIIDIEHSAVGEGQACELIMAANDAGLCPAVRINEISRGQVLKVLDAGAKALIVPHVSTVEEVKKLVSYGKFAPLGNRGYCASADGGWGCDPCYADGMEGYMRTANERTLLIPQCETMGCLENLEEIVNLEGVAGIFIGPYDLSIAMGIPGQFDHPDHIAAIEHIRKVCEAAGKLCIVFCDTPEKARGYFRQGFANVTMSVDAFMFLNSTKALVESAKDI